jgi:hypothetical protein
MMGTSDLRVLLNSLRRSVLLQRWHMSFAHRTAGDEARMRPVAWTTTTTTASSARSDASCSAASSLALGGQWTCGTSDHQTRTGRHSEPPKRQGRYGARGTPRIGL